jgi:hypothetical protein
MKSNHFSAFRPERANINTIFRPGLVKQAQLNKIKSPSSQGFLSSANNQLFITFLVQTGVL